MTAEFRCPCGATDVRRADGTAEKTEAFDAKVRRHFAGDHS